MNQRIVTARQAARLLGVKLPTLYAYVSRGLVRSVPHEEGRTRRYLRDDLERLRARRRDGARSALAERALRWGEPVLDSAITAISERGPEYRGHFAVALAEAGVPFEAVAELLWTGTLPVPAPRWRADGLGVPATALAKLLPRGGRTLAVLALLVPAIAVRDPGRYDARRDAVLFRARALIPRLAAGLTVARDPRRLARAVAGHGVARIVAAALGVDGDRRAAAAIDAALVLVADHELNVSAFAARVAASAGADVYGCFSAALAALSGSRHGGILERVEALVAEAGEPAAAERVVHERSRRGEAIPGFGHPLYPDGDPRARPLLEAARALAGTSPRAATVLALADVMRGEGRGDPTVDTGLVALAAALGLAPGAAAGIFAVGRSAGWIAHVLEQQAAGFLIRPRARYRSTPASE
ncbi:MAG: citrate synthase [Candidatus Binatota bacterium]|nr:citrate synthase [Candidatus Binatota bacterium]